MDKDTYLTIIQTLRKGYIDHDNAPHKPNNQIADILVIQAHTGLPINKVLEITTDSITDGALIIGNTYCRISQSTRDFIAGLEGSYTKTKKLFCIKDAAVYKALRLISAYLGGNFTTSSFRNIERSTS